MKSHQLGDKAIRVLVADSSHIHTHLLADALKQDQGFEVLPFDSDSESLLGVFNTNRVDVLLISSNLEEGPGAGFTLLRELRAVVPSVRAVLLLDSSTDDAVLQAFRAGARGVFSKEQPAQILGKCIRCVHEGQIWATSHEMAIAIEALASSPVVRAVNAQGMNLLSKRELQVVRSLAEGLTNREIAQRLKLSQHTVKNYLFRVFDKLGVSSRVELLFMTLTENSADPSRSRQLLTGNAANSPRQDIALLEAAEAGLPAAQLALSQMYLSRQRDPQDLVKAYTWFLVANQQASRAGEVITRKMTAQQIGEAQAAAQTSIALMAIDPQHEDGAGVESALTNPGARKNRRSTLAKRPPKAREAHPE